MLLWLVWGVGLYCSVVDWWTVIACCLLFCLFPTFLLAGSWCLEMLWLMRSTSGCCTDISSALVYYCCSDGKLTPGMYGSLCRQWHWMLVCFLWALAVSLETWCFGLPACTVSQLLHSQQDWCWGELVRRQSGRRQMLISRYDGEGTCTMSPLAMPLTTVLYLTWYYIFQRYIFMLCSIVILLPSSCVVFTRCTLSSCRWTVICVFINICIFVVVAVMLKYEIVQCACCYYHFRNVFWIVDVQVLETSEFAF